MEQYGHVLVKAFAERVDGPGLEAVLVNYKALHDQVTAPRPSAAVHLLLSFCRGSNRSKHPTVV